MNIEMVKRNFCMNCQKILEQEFIGAHKDLGHQVDLYTFGKYKNPDALKEVPKLKEERMKKASGEYAEELNSYEEE